MTLAILMEYSRTDEKHDRKRKDDRRKAIHGFR